jgi:uncharacterized Zn finger protein (UPF0148 family)
MFSSACPSCGAPIKFYSAASTTAVCGFCKSTVARDAQTLKLIGKQAQLLEDFSRIQISSEGSFKGQKFSVIGRIQLRYDQGFWNEWYLLFADGKTAWLSDASDQFAILRDLGPAKDLPTFDQFSSGQKLSLSGQSFTVVDKRTAQCVAAEGELPFPVDSRWVARTLDCRSEDQFITFDYSSSDEPRLFRGTALSFEQLELKRARELKDRFTGESAVGKLDPKKILSMACKSCGTSIKLVPNQAQRIVCPNCKSDLRLQQDSLVVEVERAEQSKVQTALSPGDSGSMYGQNWTVLGVMQKDLPEDTSVRWEEYLLYNENQGLRWASNNDGAWQWIRVSEIQPEVSGGGAVLDGQRYQLMEAYKARTIYVAGAFNWQAKVGEVVQVQEFRAGDKVLASELNEHEQTWSLGQNINGYELLGAFGKRKSLSEPSNILRSDVQDEGHHELLITSIIATVVLFVVVLPAWFIHNLDAPVAEFTLGILALWAPLWFIRQNG